MRRKRGTLFGILKEAILEGLTMDEMTERLNFASRDSCYGAIWRNNLLELYRKVQSGDVPRKPNIAVDKKETPTREEKAGLLFAWNRELGTTTSNVHTVLGEFEPYLPMKLEGIR